MRAPDLVLACMSLLDMDDFDGAVREIGRVLRPGGRLCLAVVHPFASAQDVASMHRRRLPGIRALPGSAPVHRQRRA